MDRVMAGGRLGSTVYGQQPPLEPPPLLSMLLQRTQYSDLPPPSQDTQSTYFSQAPMSQEISHQAQGLADMRKVSPHPMSRWLTDPPAPPPRGLAAGEPSQDSAVSGLSQESGPGPAAAAGSLRTKSAALEHRIDHERQQRRQLERDVREAVTVVAAHVQALPELWRALLPRLLAGVERAVQTETEKAHRQAGDRAQRLEERLEGLDAVLRRALEDGCRQSDQQVLSSLHSLRQAVSEVERRTSRTAERVQQLQRQLELDRSAPAASLSAADRGTVLQLTSAAEQVTSAVSEARRLSERLSEQLLSHQRRLAEQASRQPVVAAAAVPPLAARATCLTSPVGTVRPQPCLTPAANHRRQCRADGGASPPAKQPRAGDVPLPQTGSVSRQAPRIAPVPPKQAVAAPPQSASRSVHGAPFHGRGQPGSTGHKPREPPPPPPPPPAVQRTESGAMRSRRQKQNMMYSPESEVASLTELKGRHRPPAATPATNVYNFTWETDEPLPWPRQAAVRTYSRTPQRTPLPWPRQAAVRTYSRTPQRTPLSAVRPAGSPQELIRRSVSRPCRVASAGTQDQRRDWLH